MKIISVKTEIQHNRLKALYTLEDGDSIYLSDEMLDALIPVEIICGKSLEANSGLLKTIDTILSRMLVGREIIFDDDGPRFMRWEYVHFKN